MSRMALLALAVCISTALARSAAGDPTDIIPAMATSPASQNLFNRYIPITPDTAPESTLTAAAGNAATGQSLLLVIDTMPAPVTSQAVESCFEGVGLSLAPTLADQTDARYVSIFCKLKVAVSVICRPDDHLVQVDTAITEVFASRGNATLPFSATTGDPVNSAGVAVLATLGMGR
jgi:hypothetical protein